MLFLKTNLQTCHFSSLMILLGMWSQLASVVHRKVLDNIYFFLLLFCFWESSFGKSDGQFDGSHLGYSLLQKTENPAGKRNET